MSWSRRQFLQVMTAAAASVGVSQTALARWKDDPIFSQIETDVTERWPQSEEEWVPTICEQCPAGCGVLARVVDGRVVKLMGNPDHPLNQGAVCLKGQAAAQVLYSPDRIPGPIERAGARGEGQWRPIEWDQAIGRVAGELKQIREEGQSHTLVILGGQYRGLRDRLWTRFAEVYGTPNYIRARCQRPELPAESHVLMQGVNSPLGYHFEKARVIVSFGCNWLESWLALVPQLRTFGNLREAAGEGRVIIYHIDPRFSSTSAKADHWIPIKPGTDGALALGVAHVLIREELYDRKFVENHCFAFDDWYDETGRVHRGFRTLVLDKYSPRAVSEITGRPVWQIFQLARSLASARPSLVLGERGPAFQKHDLYARMAIHSLNALLGNFGPEGTFSIQDPPPLALWPVPHLDEEARAAVAMPRLDGAGTGEYWLSDSAAQAVPEAISRQDPYPVNALLLYQTNPLLSSPLGDAYAAALQRVPFIVSFSPFLDETTQLADLVLPDLTSLERWGDDILVHMAGYTAVSLAKPAVEPVVDGRNTTDVLLELCRQFGEPLASSFPWKDTKELLEQTFQGLYDSNRGYVVASPYQESFRKVLEKQGYRDPEYDSYRKFWGALEKKGAWWDFAASSTELRHLLASPTGKFEFAPLALQRLLRSRVGKGKEAPWTEVEQEIDSMATRLGLAARGDDLLLPHYEPAAFEGDAEQYPFILNTYKLISLYGGRSANVPWLQEHLSPLVPDQWTNWIEINPATAAPLKVADGEWVWVESPQGKLQMKARLLEGVRPEVVNIPFGFGHTALGRYAVGRGENPNELIVNQADSLKGMGIFSGTRVRITKV